MPSHPKRRVFFIKIMDYANEIKSRVSSKEAFLYYGIEFDRSGFCKCFLTGERTASLKVYDGDRGWHCFGCSAHGNVIDFVMQYFGLTFHDSLVKINMDFSLGLPIGQRMTLRQRGEMHEAEQRRKSEREKWQSEQDKLEKAYDRALVEWIRLDRQRREHQPKDQTDDFSDLFVEALQKIHGAEYDLCIAEMRLQDHGNKRPNNSISRQNSPI